MILSVGASDGDDEGVYNGTEGDTDVTGEIDVGNLEGSSLNVGKTDENGLLDGVSVCGAADGAIANGIIDTGDCVVGELDGKSAVGTAELIGAI